MTMKYINAIVRRTIAAVGGVLCCTFFTMPAFAELRDDAYLTDALTRHPTRRFPYVGRKDGKPEIALPLEGGIDRIYPVGKIEVVSKK